ncbi:AraC family transcriptional regulator [Pelagibius sp.]|uniref:AraC family transcriptional regulator n=1 Tax=Pelagibius sp. TaxID=1931238 RepID=UPI0026178C48|nr:AraC family transcriptional regulator [Pelagibius sp.]
MAARGEGIELVEARFSRQRYAPHRHDRYMICRTDAGVQGFTYRGVQEWSLHGEIVVLHPDELHDGHAGTEAGYAYQGAYVEPALVAEAAVELTGRPGPLPFAAAAVSHSPRLAASLAYAFAAEPAPLALDSLVLNIAEGLLDLDAGTAGPLPAPTLDVPAVARVRDLIDADFARSIRSAELEAVSGLSRFALARQFRARFGVTPHRYQVMRRLTHARDRIQEGTSLAAAAAEAGFADQAHFSRWFKAGYGLSPGRFAQLHRAGSA